MINPSIRAMYYLLLNQVTWVYDDRTPPQAYLNIRDKEAAGFIIRNCSKFENFSFQEVAEKILKSVIKD